MGRRYLLSDRVQIVLGTGGGKVVTKHSERSSGASVSVPQMSVGCPRNERWWRSCRLRRSPGPGMTSRWENSDTACESRLSRWGVGELLRSVSIHGHGQKARRVEIVSLDDGSFQSVD
jgi:hypothetical protein